MRHIVYAVRTKDRSETLYVGVTNDFNRRWREHCRSGRFPESDMCALGGFARRVDAERVEANTIAVLRPRFNRVQPTTANLRYLPTHRTRLIDWGMSIEELIDMAARVRRHTPDGVQS